MARPHFAPAPVVPLPAPRAQGPAEPASPADDFEWLSPEPATVRGPSRGWGAPDALASRIWALDARCGGTIDWGLSRLEGGEWALDVHLAGGWRRWVGSDPTEALEIALSARWDAPV